MGCRRELNIREINKKLVGMKKKDFTKKYKSLNDSLCQKQISS